MQNPKEALNPRTKPPEGTLKVKLTDKARSVKRKLWKQTWSQFKNMQSTRAERRRAFRESRNDWRTPNG